jgi:hypothetical protein
MTKDQKLRGGIIAVCSGVLIVGLAYWGTATSSASSSWPSTEGVILTSEVIEERDRGVSTRARRKYVYRVAVSYRYSVNGVAYEADRVSFASPTHAIEKMSERIAGKYPKGKTVQVHYNPDDPGDAVLEPGAVTYLLGMLLGLTLGGIGVVQLLRSRQDASGDRGQAAQMDSDRAE